MSKILIVSDTHGRNGLLKEVINKEKPFDLLVHCGDAECSEGNLIALADTPVYVVEGNNDYFYDLSRRIEFDYGGRHFFVTHGHYDKVYYGLDNLTYRALECNANFVLFGHTHVPCIKDIDGVTYINPGSLTHPRQTGHEPTYVTLKLIDEKKHKIELKKCTKVL